ncbi:MAG: hypothetical protein COW03_12960 [Cytophagales bacterium CG12_big_fil_rev_8_21_14_0_65_40_12]|nr:MAG: hypothetical protein COW03_12960 [Cytophagales bacterium CG12_big_fil_rev_8_21_14_0_65_40_12]PIW03049.1 MAG: hypothetical protein COW40_17035 [Cytophagales bacterium CG17_big_fil_post_rev_8_21_14_2_50_40_13]
MSKRKENKLRDEKPRVNKALEGLEIRIDSFGEIHNSLSIDKINEFLNKNVDDKKLRDRDDIDEIKGDGLEKGE